MPKGYVITSDPIPVFSSSKGAEIREERNKTQKPS
jgi:hypothetical protein